MQNPINDWNTEFQVPLAENLELLNLFPRAFPLKNGKALGTRLGITWNPQIWNPWSGTQNLESKTFQVGSLRWYHLDYIFFCLCELSDNRHLQWLEVYITKSVFFKSLYSHLQELFLRSLKYPINYAVCCRQKLAFHWYQILILNPNI